MSRQLSNGSSGNEKGGRSKQRPYRTWNMDKQDERDKPRNTEFPHPIHPIYSGSQKKDYRSSRANGPALSQPSPSGWVNGHNGFKG
jgi:hypothetical protein